MSRDQMRDLAVCVLSGGFGTFVLVAAYLLGGGR